MEKRKLNLKVILIAIPVAAALIAGVLWAQKYYNNRYAFEGCYYGVVPLDYDLTPSIAEDGMELVTYYNLTFYNADGEARELEGRVRTNMHDLYPPGTFLEFSVSKQLVIGQRAIDESGVPEKALEKIKANNPPSSAANLSEYADERTRQLSAKTAPLVNVSCAAGDNILTYTYIYGNAKSAEDMVEMLESVYKSQFRTDKLTFPELTAIFLEIKLEGGIVVFSQKYDQMVIFNYEME